MLATQREVGLAVIELVLFPRLGVVAVLAFLAVFTFVGVIVFVTAETIGGQFQFLVFVLFQLFGCVATVARGFLVLAV